MLLKPQLSSSLIGLALLALSTSCACAQVVGFQGTNAPGVLAPVSAAFSGGQAVAKVQLTGSADWFAGSLKDSGSVNLTALADGSYQMQLSLATTGQLTETQTGNGSSAQCKWSGKDAVLHSVDVGNCWRPALWILPAMSLQKVVLTKEQSFADLGMGTVGAGTAVYHHLQGQIVPVSKLTTATNDWVKRSTTDIWLDPISSLPMILEYSVHPNNGAPVSIAVEVHYSDYRNVAGAQIPFHIERYVNGALQLDIHISSAVIN